MVTSPVTCHRIAQEQATTKLGETIMGNADYDPERFGKVIATLDAQNVVLSGMRTDIDRIFSMIYAMQIDSRKGQGDWLKLLASAMLGAAMTYFLK